MIRRYILILTLFAISFSAEYEEIPDIVTKVGTSVGNWLKLETDPRAVAMGGAQVAVGDGVSSIPYNPAAIAFLENSQIYYSRTNYLAGITFNTMAYGRPVGFAGDFLGIHFFQVNSGLMDVTTAEFPDGTGEQFSDIMIALRGTYAKVMTDRLKVGVSLKYIWEQIHTAHMSTIAVDIGSNFDTGIYGFILGMSVTNFGLDGKFEGEGLYKVVPKELDVDERLAMITEEFPLPMAFRVGVKNIIDIDAYNKIVFAIDGVNPLDYIVTGNTGIEYSWRDVAFLRAGSHLGHDTAAYTFGAGVRISNIYVDYAFASYSVLEDTHQFGFRFGF